MLCGLICISLNLNIYTMKKEKELKMMRTVSPMPQKMMAKTPVKAMTVKQAQPKVLGMVKVGVTAPTPKQYYGTIVTNLPSNPKQRAVATELKNIQERKRRNY